MKALILAAGYATRLRPLTDSIPKMLLPLAERPMLDYLLDRLREVDELDEIQLVTNARFAQAFEDWAPEDVTVLDDGTTSNEDRLGAIGDIAFAIERGGLEGEDLLIVAGDNLIGYSLAGLRRLLAVEGRKRDRSARGRRPRAAHAVRRRRARRDDRVSASRRSPPSRRATSRRRPRTCIEQTTSRCCRATSTRATRRTRRATSSPGCTVASPSTAIASSGEWHDIGDLGQLLEADNLLRERAGLPMRSEYSLI